MKMRVIGKDLRASAVGLGCMGMTHASGAPANPGEMTELLAKAVEMGDALFDTAECYTGTNADDGLAGTLFNQIHLEPHLFPGEEVGGVSGNLAGSQLTGPENQQGIVPRGRLPH